MNTTLLNVTRLNVTELNVTRLNTVGASLRRDGIPPAIRRSMVLWYDIARQGCTNESMAANPVLRDLSGNGHDATCYNFAWSGMSGIGGYDVVPLKDWMKNSDITTEVINANKVIITSYKQNFGIRTNYDKGATITIRVSEIQSELVKIIYLNSSGSETLQSITEEGTYTFKPPYNEEESFNQMLISGLATIELLPQYPNALVADGVDDYAYAEGLPILTKEKGYTIVTKRKVLDYSTGQNDLKCLASNSKNWNVDGAFVFEYQNTSTMSITFGKTLVTEYPEEISWQTSVSYNGNAMTLGNYLGSDVLVLFKPYKDTGKYTLSALYSFLLFDRDLTSEEIDWVKTNLMGVVPEQKRYLLTEGGGRMLAESGGNLLLE